MEKFDHFRQSVNEGAHVYDRYKRADLGDYVQDFGVDELENAVAYDKWDENYVFIDSVEGHFAFVSKKKNSGTGRYYDLDRLELLMDNGWPLKYKK